MADAMQKKLQKMVKKLREDEIDLTETPVLFTWTYEEDPSIQYKLFITEINPSEIEIDSDVIH